MWLKLTVCFAVASTVSTNLIGNHVCEEEERYTLNVTEYFIKNATVRNYEWCLHVPPRCSVYTTKKLNVSRIIEQEQVRYVNKCCPGFIENENKCIATICTKCVHGNCKDDVMCHCKSGYHGDDCSFPCGLNRWGVNCVSNCTCERGTCDPQTGSCICPPGWTGNNCEIRCPVGRFGSGCNSFCNCSEDDSCDAVSGKCLKRENPKSDAKIVENLRMKSLSNPEMRTNPVLIKYYTFDDYYSSTQKNIVNVTDEKNFIPKKNIEEDRLQNRNSQVPSNVYYDHTEPTTKRAIKISTTQDTLLHVTEVDVTMSHSTTRIVLEKSDKIIEERADVDIEMTDQSVARVTKENDEVKTTKGNNEAKGKASLEIDDVVVTTMFNFMLSDSHQVIQQEHQVTFDDLVFNIGTVVVLTVGIIAIAAIIVAVQRHRLKVSKTQEKTTRSNAGMQTVSVYTRSTFHTPLPEPPVIENPIFTTPTENNATFQTHVVCSMNFPNRPNATDCLYDHPPSTGSYRAASVPEPPDIDVNNVITSTVNEPVYDEIPCWGRPAPVTEQPPPSYRSTDTSLYMNTCVKTRL